MIKLCSPALKTSLPWHHTLNFLHHSSAAINYTTPHIPTAQLPNFYWGAFRPFLLMPHPLRAGEEISNDYLCPRQFQLNRLEGQIEPCGPGIGILHAVEPLQQGVTKQRVKARPGCNNGGSQLLTRHSFSMVVYLASHSNSLRLSWDKTVPAPEPVRREGDVRWMEQRFPIESPLHQCKPTRPDLGWESRCLSGPQSRPQTAIVTSHPQEPPNLFFCLGIEAVLLVSCESSLPQRRQNRGHPLHKRHPGVSMDDNIVQVVSSMCSL